jgi:hypothetical protein
MRHGTILIVTVAFSMALLAMPASAKRKKKSDEPPPPDAGVWFDYRGTQCYNPPAFADEPNEPKRRMLRQGAMEEMLRLLRGEVNEQIVVSDERKIDSWETDFLGKPTGIEPFVIEGLDKCKAFAEGELGLSTYVSWLADGGNRATVGDCHNPLAYELHQNMSVQDGWQVRRHMCVEDQVLIETTESNKYTVADTGDYDTTVWINPEGDLDQPEAGEGFPCPTCPVGAVVYRFEFEDASREPTIAVLGASMEFTAPANGFISFTVNDLSYFDNTFHEANGVIDYLPISVYPPILGVDVGE